MKAIIVQAGGGFYGVNVRLITDEEAEVVKAALADCGTKNSDDSFTIEVWDKHPLEDGDHAMVWIQDVEVGKSFGFDSGMWRVAEKVIDEMMGKDGRYQG